VVKRKFPVPREVCQERPTESTYVSDGVEQAGIWPRARELQLGKCRHAVDE